MKVSIRSQNVFFFSAILCVTGLDSDSVTLNSLMAVLGLMFLLHSCMAFHKPSVGEPLLLLPRTDKEAFVLPIHGILVFGNPQDWFQVPLQLRRMRLRVVGPFA